MRPFFCLNIVISRTQIQFQSNTVVTNSQIQFSNRIVTTSSIKICVSILWININYTGKIFNSFFVSCLSFKRYSSIMKSVNILTILLYNIRVINDSLWIPSELGKTVCSIVKSFNICRLTSIGIYLTILYFILIVFDS